MPQALRKLVPNLKDEDIATIQSFLQVIAEKVETKEGEEAKILILSVGNGKQIFAISPDLADQLLEPLELDLAEYDF